MHLLILFLKILINCLQFCIIIIFNFYLTCIISLFVFYLFTSYASSTGYAFLLYPFSMGAIYVESQSLVSFSLLVVKYVLNFNLYYIKTKFFETFILIGGSGKTNHKFFFLILHLVKFFTNLKLYIIIC